MVKVRQVTKAGAVDDPGAHETGRSLLLLQRYKNKNHTFGEMNIHFQKGPLLWKNTGENHRKHLGWNENKKTGGTHSTLATFSTKALKRDKMTSGEYIIPGPPTKPGGYSNLGVSIGCEQMCCPILYKISKWICLVFLVTSLKRPPVVQSIAQYQKATNI